MQKGITVQPDLKRISHALSSTLRHNAIKQGLTMNKMGQVKVRDLLDHPQYKKMKCTLEILQRVVAESDKKRFGLEYEQDEWMIRCYQGHSIKFIDNDSAMTQLTSLAHLNILIKQRLKEQYQQEVTSVVHGTYMRVLEPILQSGLHKMGRNHIHLSIGVKGDSQVISGMRYSCEVYVYLDLDKAINDGMVFYLSENNVVLSSGINGLIPTKYFTKVTSSSGTLLFPQ